MRSVSELAFEEQRRLDHGLQLLGDTYDLIADMEALFDHLPTLCRLPSEANQRDAALAVELTRTFIWVSRRQLTIGTLSLLRGHRGDSELQLRRAIEYCAFAAKMRTHPHMATLWVDARRNDETFETFRGKFKKLFPEGDPDLSKLGRDYDRCSKAMHASIYGVAGYFAAHVAAGNQPGTGISVFDVETDGALIAFFFLQARCYLAMLRVFGRLLAGCTDGQIVPWTEELTKVEEAFRLRRKQWMPFLAQALPTEV